MQLEQTRRFWLHAILAACVVAAVASSAHAQVCPNATVTRCPTALEAAQVLTANSSYLPISGATISGTCDATRAQWAITSSFPACHHIAAGMPSGAVVLSTGNATVAGLSNNNGNSDLRYSKACTDADLQAVSALTYSQDLNDCNILTFNVTPTASGPISFSFVVASEEYPASNSTMNDIFGFWWWASNGTRKNIALLPGTNTPVSIASVNRMSSQFYLDNAVSPRPYKSAMDGMTVLLNTSTVNVSAGITYTIKLGIADGGDSAFDSFVYIKAGSLSCTAPPVLPRNCTGSYSAWSACSASCGPGNQTRTYTISQTAEPGGNACAASNNTVQTASCNNNCSSASPSPYPSASPPPTSHNTTSSMSPSPDNTTSPSPSPDNSTSTSPSPSPDNTTSPSPSPDNTTSPSPSHDNSTSTSPSPDNTTSPSPSPNPDNTTSPSPNPDITTSPSPSPDNTTSPSPSPDNTTSPSPSPSPDNTTSPSPSPDNTTSPSPSPDNTTSPSPSPSPDNSTPASPSPSPDNSTSPSPSPSPSLQFPDYIIGPPILQPPPPMDDSGIKVRGGNVSITGIKVQSSSASVGGAPSPPADVSTTALKQRTAAFNGSLGFFTLGLSIDVLGEFKLQRTMNWIYNSRSSCWITQVLVAGKFRLTWERFINNALVGVDVLEPDTSGKLTMFSAIYPGPGFSGTYDWSGTLDMEPDPFALWGFQPISTGINSRVLLEDQDGSSPKLDWIAQQDLGPAKYSRNLLQSDEDTGNLPVQGRVSVREARDPDATVGGPAPAPGMAAAIDDDITALFPVPPNPDDAAGIYPPPPSPQEPLASQDILTTLVQALLDPGTQKTIILVASIVASLVGATCFVCIGAACWRRRQRRKHAQNSKSKQGATDVSAGVCKQSDTLYRDPSTNIQALQPGDAGDGSWYGGPVPPPSRDSTADGAGDAAHGLPLVRTRTMEMINNFRSSLTGMAAGVAAAVRLHRGASGDVYKVQQPIPPGLLRGPSLELHPAAQSCREPTLPDVSRRSVDAGAARALPPRQARPQAGAAAAPRQAALQPQGSPAGALSNLQTRTTVAATASRAPGSIPAATQLRQQQQAIAAQWLPQYQAILQGRAAAWATADLHYLHTHVQDNPEKLEGEEWGGR